MKSTDLASTSGTSPTGNLNPYRLDRLLFSKREAAYSLSISVRKLEYLIQQGIIKAKHIGRSVRISRKVLERFAAA